MKETSRSPLRELLDRAPIDAIVQVAEFVLGFQSKKNDDQRVIDNALACEVFWRASFLRYLHTSDPKTAAKLADQATGEYQRRWIDDARPELAVVQAIGDDEEPDNDGLHDVDPNIDESRPP